MAGPFGHRCQVRCVRAFEDSFEKVVETRAIESLARGAESTLSPVLEPREEGAEIVGESTSRFA